MKDDRVYLSHMLEAIEKIESYVSAGRDVFMAASHWQDAVTRQLEIIGEATKRLSTQLRSQYPTVPWRRMAGLRDKLIHDYMAVDLVALWEITQNDIPALKGHIQAMLEQSARE